MKRIIAIATLALLAFPACDREDKRPAPKVVKKATKPEVVKKQKRHPLIEKLNETHSIMKLTKKMKDCVSVKDYACAKKHTTAVIKLTQKHKRDEKCSNKTTYGEYQASLRLNRALFNLKLNLKEKSLDDLEWIEKHGYIPYLFLLGSKKTWDHFDKAFESDPRYKKLLQNVMNKIKKEVKKTELELKEFGKELKKPR